MPVSAEKGRIIGVPNRDILGEDAVYLGTLLGSWLGKGSIVITGRDYAPASRMIKRALAAGFMAAGVDVMDLHSAVMGEVAYAMKRFGASGGVLVSQYPLEPPAVQIRVFHAPGREVVGDELRSLLGGEPRRVDPGEAGWLVYAEYIHDLYVSAIKSFIDLGAMKRRLRVAVSLGQGPASRVIPGLLDDMVADYVLTGLAKPPSHEPLRYPLLGEIEKVSNMVRELGLDAGFVLNNDASAMIVVDERGNVLLPEETGLALATDLPEGSHVVIDERCMGFLAESLSGSHSVYAAPREPGAVARTVVEKRPALGLSGLGEYIYPLFSLGYDAVLAMAKLIEVLDRGGGKLSRLAMTTVPKYYEITAPIDPGEAARLVCGERCEPFIAGYRWLGDGARGAVVPGPGGARILIDALSPGAGEEIRRISRVLRGGGKQ